MGIQYAGRLERGFRALPKAPDEAPAELAYGTIGLYDDFARTVLVRTDAAGVGSISHRDVRRRSPPHARAHVHGCQDAHGLILKVLDTMRDGYRKHADIAEKLDCELSKVRNAVRRIYDRASEIAEMECTRREKEQ